MPLTDNSTCAGCGKQICDKKFISCCDSKCEKQFHLACVAMKSINTDIAKSWLCPVCRCNLKKGGDNSTTPVRCSQNVTVRKPKVISPVKDVSSEKTSSLDNLTEQIMLLREEILIMKADFAQAIAAVSRCESKIVEMDTRITSYESRLKNAEESTVEMKHLNDSLKSQITSQSEALMICEDKLKSLEDTAYSRNDVLKSIEAMQEQLNNQAQAGLRNDVEISGVCEKPGENPTHLFLTLAMVAGVKLLDSDVEYVTRVGPARSNPNDHPRPIVVRFCRRNIRDQFYNAARPRRITTAEIKLDGPAQSIFVNDRLTRDNRQLFRESRIRFKEAGYRFCWTKWGQIYVKKGEGRGEGAKAIPVGSFRDIENVLKRTPSAPINSTLSQNAV